MKVPNTEFVEFQKIPRLSRDIIVTEKIDGTNAQIYIPDVSEPDYGEIYAGSRSGWITPEKDNHGFAQWVEAHKQELLMLGPGHHFGEWWGSGIQRGYGLTKGEKRFSLFNTTRWADGGKDCAKRPSCCGTVPILYAGPFDLSAVEECLDILRVRGSIAAPGFKRPEGVVVFHTAGSISFKKTLEKDDVPKSLVKENG